MSDGIPADVAAAAVYRYADLVAGGVDPQAAAAQAVEKISRAITGRRWSA